MSFLSDNLTYLASLALSLKRMFPNQKEALQQLSYGQAFRHAAATPLSSLLLNLEMVEQHHTFEESPYLKQAVNNAQRLKKLFRLEDGVKEEKFLVKLAIEAAIKLARPLQQQVLVRSHLAFPKDLRLKGSKFYFQEAVICTLKNALEAYNTTGPDKNRLVLITGRQQKMKSGEPGLKLAFIDGGSGLGWWQRSLVFAEGYTTKKTGTGFGLVWVKRVVKEHFQGEIVLKSRKHCGTTLTWLLPLKT